jgi:hypothetical protein
MKIMQFWSSLKNPPVHVVFQIAPKPYYDTYTTMLIFPASFPGSALVLLLTNQNRVIFHVLY